MPKLSLRDLRARAGATAPGPSAEPETIDVRRPPAPSGAPSPEILRAIRLGATIENQGRAVGAFKESEARLRQMMQAHPEHPLGPVLQEQVEQLRPDVGTVLTPEIRAALEREQARTGRVLPAPRTTGLGAALSRLPQSAIKYPLKALVAGTRIFDAPVPAMFKKAIEQQATPLPLVPPALLLRVLNPFTPSVTWPSGEQARDQLIAAGAAADPLGRFTETGARAATWSQPPTTWNDVAEAALKRWGRPVKAKFPGPGAFGTVVSGTAEGVTRSEVAPPLELAGLGQTGTQVLGTVADVALSPSSGLTAGIGATAGRKAVTIGGRTIGETLPRSAGIRFYGQTIVPDRLVRSVARGTGIPQVAEAIPRIVKAAPIPGTSKTFGDVLGPLFSRYYQINQIEDPFLREEMLRIAMMSESARAAQTASLTDRAERAFRTLSPEDEIRVRDIVENPSGFDLGAPPPPAPFPSTELGRPSVPVGPAESFAGHGSTAGPATIPGMPASPTAVSGTPDVARYGAIPEHLSGQLPIAGAGEIESAARVENILADVRRELQKRGLIRGRENYFPLERTAASLQLERGMEARAERLGRGSARLDFRAGFEKGRKEHGRINDLIARVNRQDAEAAARAGLPAPEPIPFVEDTTSAINAFWRRLPERLRQEIGQPEPERFLDRPKETLQRYLARATKAINDYDTLQAVRRLQTETGRDVARPFVKEEAGRVWEDVPTPEYTFWRPDREPPPIPIAAERQLPAPPPSTGEEAIVPTEFIRKLYPGLFPEGQGPKALPGEVTPPAPGAFKGVSPMDPTAKQRPIYGYTYPKNPSWRQAFPDMALPRPIAAWVDAFAKPYWNDIERLVVQPFHKMQLPWKVAATSGAGLRFGLRNDMSQMMFNFQEYGAPAFLPRIQLTSRTLGLPDAIVEASPKIANQKIRIRSTGEVYTGRELREVAKQTGLWRTKTEAETWSALGGPFGETAGGPARSSAVRGWGKGGAAASALLGAVGRGAQKVTRAVAPLNPISKDFFATKYVFGPFSDWTERSGRMAAFILELERGKPLLQAAQDAAKVHVNYQTFAPAFEKYGTLAYPFAKFTVGMLPNQVRWALQYPGRTMLTEHLLRGGEHMVPEEERERYAREPKSQLAQEAGARLVGMPWGGGALKEPEIGRAGGPGRLPFTTVPPTADVLLNTLGAIERIRTAKSHGKQLSSEVVEDAFPAFKVLYELSTHRNVATGEPIDLWASQPAPRSVQLLYEQAPEVARQVFKAQIVNVPGKGRYLATPTAVNLIWRYYPNVAAFDLATAFLGGKKPYDNKTAIALRLLGVTQLLHDPLVPASQTARENAARTEDLRHRVQGWTPAP